MPAPLSGEPILPAAAGTRVWTRVVSLLRERPSFAARRKKAKTRPGNSSERTSLAPFLQNRDTAKTTYRSVAPPHQIETVRFDLRRTFRRNLQAATKKSCAIFRRIRTRLRPHWIPHFWTRDGGLRGTMDDVPSPVIARPARRLVVAIRASCPKSAHHAAPLPSLPCKSVPPRGAFPFPAPENFPAPHCNICPPVV